MQDWPVPGAVAERLGAVEVAVGQIEASAASRRPRRLKVFGRSR